MAAIGIDRDELAHLAARLARSIKTLNALPDREAKWVYSSSTWWPEVIHLREEAYGYGEASARRFVPGADDVDDMARCMDMLAWLKRQNDGLRDFRVIWARANGIAWWRLSERFGRSEKQLRRWHDGAVARIWCEFCAPRQNMVA